jgi:hypothetical protein
MRAEILQRFQDNLARVDNLVTVYQNLGGGGRGRRPLHAADILRGATVLMHASLEEVFRSVGKWRIPSLGEFALNDVPLVGVSETGRAEKFWLGKLAVHRTKSVQALIDESVVAHMNNFSINNPNDMAAFMRKVGVEPQPYDQHFAALAELIQRRHHIVHQADRNDQPGPGHQRARSISVAQVSEWATATRAFITRFLQEIPDELL